MFERETRREKILEARNKELRLKEKTKGILGLGGGGGLSIGGGSDSTFGKVAYSTMKGTHGQGPGGAGKGGGAGGEEQAEQAVVEDPIVKAEREFFQVIKQVFFWYFEFWVNGMVGIFVYFGFQEQESRLELRKQKMEADKEYE